MVRLRGGGDSDANNNIKPLEWFPAAVAASRYAAAVVLAGVTVTLVRRVPRSGGHAPRLSHWVRTFVPLVSPPVVAPLFHGAYIAHAGMVLHFMPESIRDMVFSPGGVILLGTVFPMVESIRAAGTDSVADDNTWLQVK